MAKPKFTLYKHIKIDGQWRYFRAAVASNNKVKPHVIVVGGQEQKHEDGSYCVRHKNQWIDVGTIQPKRCGSAPSSSRQIPSKRFLLRQPPRGRS